MEWIVRFVGELEHAGGVFAFDVDAAVSGHVAGDFD
jgi:hypothetical protein